MHIKNLSAAIDRQIMIPEELHGYRLDQALASLFSEFSRAQLQQWIRQGVLQIDGTVVLLPRTKVQSQQLIKLQTELKPRENWDAQEIPLTIIYADDDLIVINKPAGLVVHPGAGNHDQTLLNALLHYDPQLAHVPRAGLIHRLDKDTSGILLIARNLHSHCRLVQDLQQRQIKRVYQAIIQGRLISGGTIIANMGRHPQQRIKMAVRQDGRTAITHYRIIQRFSQFTHVEVQLETGRTHQIRVHFEHIKHSLIGDPLYGKKKQFSHKLHPQLYQQLQEFPRQALHACSLEVIHPRSGEALSWQAPLPADFCDLLANLKTYNKL